MYFIASTSDDSMSLAKIDAEQGVFSFTDNQNDGNHIVILKFSMSDGSLLENFSIKIDYYPSGSEISGTSDLNIYGSNFRRNEVAFIRVCIMKH